MRKVRALWATPQATRGSVLASNSQICRATARGPRSASRAVIDSLFDGLRRTSFSGLVNLEENLALPTNHISCRDAPP